MKSDSMDGSSINSDAYLPKSLTEALDIRAREAVTVCAGGTDLMVQHARGYGLPAHVDTPVLFIGHLEELNRIGVTDGGVRIGAAVTIADFGGHDATAAGPKQIVNEFAAPGIRNRGTIGGNVCNASPAGDLLPYFFVADAKVILRSSDGERELPIAEFIAAPGRTNIKADELLVAIYVPTWEHARLRSFYRKVAPRRSNALSKLSVYCEWASQAGVLLGMRLAIGAVAPTVVRARKVESHLTGLSADELRARAAAIAEAYAPLIVPIDDQRSTATYRKNTALSLVRYILQHAIPDDLEST